MIVKNEKSPKFSFLTTNLVLFVLRDIIFHHSTMFSHKKWMVSTEGFLPILAGIQDHRDTETFKLIFSYLEDNSFPAPTALQADGCKATRKALKEIWPDCDLCMCWFHTKKNCKREPGKFSECLSFAPFLLIYLVCHTKSFLKKNLVFAPNLVTFLHQIYLVFFAPKLYSGISGAAPLCANTNNGLER